MTAHPQQASCPAVQPELPATETCDRILIRGVVERGRQMGRRLGFPTANIGLGDAPIPRLGVYATRSQLADGRVFDGVASLGCNPTLPKDAPVLEVWLFDFDEQIYAQLLSTELVAFIRDEAKFDSLSELSAQVLRDAAAARAILRGGEPVLTAMDDP